LVAALPNYAATQFGSTNVTAELNASGSTFAEPIYTKWFPLYKTAAPNVKINYQATGSGNGRAAFLGTPVSITPIPKVPSDFADSDAAFTAQQLADSKIKNEIVHIPLALGGVAVAYHIDGLSTQLRLAGTTLANIFLGNITNWNDAAIAADNPGIALPNKPIRIVIRSRTTSSGTTEIFTRYLSVVSADFRTKVGPGGAPKWLDKNQLEGADNDAIAALISQNDGAVGYVDLNSALDKKLAMASIRNVAGRYISPSVDSVTAAAQGISIPDDFRIFVVNAEGEGAYPIAGFTWLITWKDLTNMPGSNPDKANAMANFMWWAIHTGQDNLPNGFARLPASLTPRLEALFVNSDSNKVFKFNKAPIFQVPK
jgi:phosphate transport system substrate-binding protein